MQEPYSFEALFQHTNAFFSKHWNSSVLGEPPEWKRGWAWKGSVPYHDKGGVYALFDKGNTLLYIGLGASVGGGSYKEHGLSRRLLAHVITTDPTKGKGHYVPQKKWTEVASIAGIGFEAGQSYVAAALEDYLIWNLSPPRNSTKKRGIINSANN
jgi:hypothetical protein